MTGPPAGGSNMGVGLPRLLILLLSCFALAISPLTLAHAQSPAGSLGTEKAPDAATSEALARALAQGAQKIGPQRGNNIEAELVPMDQWVVPGGTAIVAIRQTIDAGWHTYWRNPGDSGGPTEVTWFLPGGFSAGDIVWPLPDRQRLQTLMNYGYEGTVYLPVPIQIPASAKVGDTVRISADVLFMVCSDQMCIPVEMTLAADLPVREGRPALNGAAGKAIADVLESAPREAPIDARLSLEGGKLVLSAAGGPLAGAEPRWVYFFPFASALIDHAAPQTGQRGSEGLTLDIQPSKSTLADGLQTPVRGVLATDLGAWEISAIQGEALADTRGAGLLGDVETDQVSSAAGLGFVQVALMALLGGLILNLMPCVFPVLAMKAAALSRSAHHPAEARRDGLAFLAGVLVSFVVLAGLLLALRAGGQAVGWGFHLQSPAVTAALALLMLAVALNMSGLYHVGGTLQALAGNARVAQGGQAGAFFTGMLAVVVAAPCTAPFMALALGAALVMPWPLALLVFVMLGLGLALPYVLISLSPRLLARMPKPGAWMETLRNLLAFPMYATALWLAWVFARQASDALGLLFAAGLLLSLALWLLGRFQSHGGRAMLVGAIASAVLAGAATVFAMATPTAGKDAEAVTGTVLPSQPWSEQAVAQALAQGQPVLVNFTADWCVTCKINERTALSSAATAEALTKANAVYLVGDWTRRDDAITTELQKHGRSGVPLYLLYTPGQAQPQILPQLLTEGLVAKALAGAAS